MNLTDEIFNKYKIEHADGTPLHGKKYFVLRLDSDNPEEASRVNAAMNAYFGYKKHLNECVTKLSEALALVTKALEGVTCEPEWWHSTVLNKAKSALNCKECKEVDDEVG